MKHPNVAALIRTWSNRAEECKLAVERARVCGIGWVIVVVNDNDPKLYNVVERALESSADWRAGKITLMPMRLYYSWSNALNHGFEEVRRRNLAAVNHGRRLIDYVLNVSNEVAYTAEDVDAMIAEIQDTTVGAVGTTFDARKPDGTKVELGKTYENPRNTMTLTSVIAYSEVGGYNPMCDAAGGQEDLEWLVRMELTKADVNGQKLARRYVMLDRKVPLIVDVNYDQAQKEDREFKAIISALETHEYIANGIATKLANIS